MKNMFYFSKVFILVNLQFITVIAMIEDLLTKLLYSTKILSVKLIMVTRMIKKQFCNIKHFHLLSFLIYYCRSRKLQYSNKASKGKIT